MITRTPSLLLLLWSLLAATSTTSPCSAFSPISSVRPRHQSARLLTTQRHVLDNKWLLPFSSDGKSETEKPTAMRDASTSDFEQQLKKSPLMSSFFPQDTVEDASDSMGDLAKFLNPKGTKETQGDDIKSDNPLLPLLAVVGVAIAAVGAGVVSGYVPTSEISGFVQGVVADPTSALEQVTETVAGMGPLGPVYFGLMYTLAEVLAIPAIPLTASAGYLFGVSTGTLVVLLSASVAASISFAIGRTLLRDTVENAMKDNPQFTKLDKAIGREGFKLMLLLRLSPIFPFALSNYLYGASSIDFASFFWGTLVGFAPGTLAYVYTGVVGKALTLGGDGTQPWYVYAGGAAVLGGLLKLLVDVAGNIIEEMEEAADQQQ